MHGRPFECPLAPDRRQPVSGYRELVEELLALHEVSAADLEASADAVPGGAVAHDRAVQLHGTPASLYVAAFEFYACGILCFFCFLEQWALMIEMCSRLRLAEITIVASGFLTVKCQGR